MRKIMSVSFVLVMLALWGGKLAQAQEQQEEQEQTKAKPVRPTAQENKPKAEQTEKPVHAYRLDFSINELEGGKKVNTRHYSMNLSAGHGMKAVSIGTRVPIPEGSGPNPVQYQYMDVDTNILCRLDEVSGGDLALDVSSLISNFATPAGQEHAGSMPVIRHMKIEGSTVVIQGKPTIIGSVDDPYSNREFQLEVTATRLK